MRLFLAGLLVVGLVGCSDDTEPQPTADLGADTAVTDTAVGSDSVADTAAPDQAVADTSPTPDTAGGDSAKAPKVLTDKHTGWNKKDCFASGCHTSPIKGHTATKPPECAKCHGGNGACDPNGASSGKKNHTQTLCGNSNCHSGKHGFTDKADCVACHFAAQGTVDCK